MDQNNKYHYSGEHDIVNQNLSTIVPTSELPIGDEEPITDKYKLLTSADLQRLDTEQPKWKRIRIAILVLFWVIWVALLVALVVIIVLIPKCPPIPEQQFWQKKVGYWVDVFGFKDSNGDFIGDLQGLFDGHSYIKNELGAEYVILDVISDGQFTNSKLKLGLVDSFNSVDKAAGSMDKLKAIVKAFHKIGMEVVLSLDLNSVAINSKLATSENIKKAIPNTFTRAGAFTNVTVQNELCYTVKDTNTVDLDLESEGTVDIIKKSILDLLSTDIDGILLKSAAFYIEGSTSKNSITASSNTDNEWFTQYPTGQIYNRNSVEFVSRINKLIKGNTRASGKARLFAIDPGDTGYGIEGTNDLALMFLNASGDLTADMVISRQFVEKRGWKTTPKDLQWTKSTLENYVLATGDNKRLVGLATGTPSDRSTGSVLSLASVLLLPGIPIIYYGNELGTQTMSTITPLKEIYPRGKISFPNLSEGDTTLPSHLPLPWSNKGVGFSESSDELSDAFLQYIQSHGVTETIETATSAGRGYSPFGLVKSLIALRQQPSLQWGEFTVYDKHLVQNEASRMEVFVRKAEGFPAFLVAMNNPEIVTIIRQPGVTLDFTGICVEVKVAFVYPSDENLKKGDKIVSQQVYLPITQNPAVYVFQCLD